jgi:hypothetical protein
MLKFLGGGFEQFLNPAAANIKGAAKVLRNGKAICMQ